MPGPDPDQLANRDQMRSACRTLRAQYAEPLSYPDDKMIELINKLHDIPSLPRIEIKLRG